MRTTTQTLRWLAATAVGLLALQGAQAQSVLNPRWHGTWLNGTEQLVVSANGLKTSERSCRWTTGRPKSSPKDCVAFYDAGVPKSQLVTMFDAAEREIRRQSQDRQSPLAPEDRKRLQDDLAKHRRVLASVSEDTFRSVALDSQSMDGDCTAFYFLDREFIYEVTSCPYPEANALKQYRKQPG